MLSGGSLVLPSILLCFHSCCCSFYFCYDIWYACWYTSYSSNKTGNPGRLLMEPEYLSLEPVKGFNTAQATQSPNLPSRSTHSSCTFLLSAPARAGAVGLWALLAPPHCGCCRPSGLASKPKQPCWLPEIANAAPFPNLHANVIDVGYLVMLFPSSLSHPCHQHGAGSLLLYCCWWPDFIDAPVFSEDVFALLDSPSLCSNTWSRAESSLYGLAASRLSTEG